MKLKIKVKLISNTSLPEIIDKGDWIDLRAAETVVLTGPQSGTLKKINLDGKSALRRDVTFSSQLIPLGIAMKLPKGFEAVMLPRSSTLKSFGVIMGNSQGVIDNSYCGDSDEWKFNAVALANTTILKDSRICQFRIQLSQKASFLSKIKWLLCSGIKLVKVETLGNKNRGGIGSTGKL